MLTEFQVQELSDLFVSEYYYLKVTEVALFVKKMKAGHLGKMFGNFSPSFVAECMQEFLKQRKQDIDRVEAKRRNEKREQEMEESVRNRATPEEQENVYRKFIEENKNDEASQRAVESVRKLIGK